MESIMQNVKKKGKERVLKTIFANSDTISTGPK